MSKKGKEMTRESIQGIFNSMTDLLLKKNHDYKGASFDLGFTGNFVHLWDKVMRLKRVFDNPNDKPNFESIEDTYRDIIGYCVIGLHIIGVAKVDDKEEKGATIEDLSKLSAQLQQQYPTLSATVIDDIISKTVTEVSHGTQSN